MPVPSWPISSSSRRCEGESGRQRRHARRAGTASSKARAGAAHPVEIVDGALERRRSRRSASRTSAQPGVASRRARRSRPLPSSAVSTQRWTSLRELLARRSGGVLDLRAAAPALVAGELRARARLSRQRLPSLRPRPVAAPPAGLSRTTAANPGFLERFRDAGERVDRADRLPLVSAAHHVLEPALGRERFLPGRLERLPSSRTAWVAANNPSAGGQGRHRRAGTGRGWTPAVTEP